MELVKKINLVVIMVFSFCFCAQKPEFDSLTPAEFEKLIKENKSVQLVDVRRQVEYDSAHIDKAILIDVLDSGFVDRAKLLLDKSKPVAVYCRSGRRSKNAAGMLVKEGFIVFDLDSGYLGWIEYKTMHN